MKTEQEIRKEIKRLEKQIDSLLHRARGIGGLFGAVCLSGRNQIRIAALKWVLNEVEKETKHDA